MFKGMLSIGPPTPWVPGQLHWLYLHACLSVNVMELLHAGFKCQTPSLQQIDEASNVTDCMPEKGLSLTIMLASLSNQYNICSVL